MSAELKFCPDKLFFNKHKLRYCHFLIYWLHIFKQHINFYAELTNVFRTQFVSGQCQCYVKICGPSHFGLYILTQLSLICFILLSFCFRSVTVCSHANRHKAFVTSQPEIQGTLLCWDVSDFYEYMYTAQNSGGFVFISLGDTFAVDPLHLFHLRRLRLALQVRSHHASMLPRHQSTAERAQASSFLFSSFSTANFHQLLVFCIFLLPWSYQYPIVSLSPMALCFPEARTGVNTAPGMSSSLTSCQNRCACGQEVWGSC